LVGNYTVVEDTEDNIEVKIVEPEIKPAAKVVLPDKIIKVEDEVEIMETIIESTEIDETDAIIIDLDKDFASVEEEEEVVEEAEEGPIVVTDGLGNEITMEKAGRNMCHPTSFIRAKPS